MNQPLGDVKCSDSIHCQSTEVRGRRPTVLGGFLFNTLILNGQNFEKII
jgi:hypothetical protein